MSKLYLCNSINYYNRIEIINKNYIAEYGAYLLQSTAAYPNPITNHNFKIKDGVDTQVTILNDKTPSYIIRTDDNDNILDRWFVMDSTFNTAAGKNEQILVLRRDLIVDYYDKIKNTDIYIDRGWAVKGDPFVTANEGFSFNQLLKSRTPINDSTNCAWVIGYMSTSPIYYDDALTEKTAVSTAYSDSILNRAEVFNSMSDFPGYNVSTNKPNNTFGIPKNNNINVKGISTKVTYYEEVTSNVANKYNYKLSTNFIYGTVSGYPKATRLDPSSAAVHNADSFIAVETSSADIDAQASSHAQVLNTLFTQVSADSANLYNKLNDYYVNAIIHDNTGYKDLEELKNIEGRLFYDATNSKYYTAKIVKENAGTTSINWNIDPRRSDEGSNFNQLQQALINYATPLFGGVNYSFRQFDSTVWDCDITYVNWMITFTEYTPQSGLYVNISNTRNNLIDAPYCMFAIPCSYDFNTGEVGKSSINLFSGFDITTAGANTAIEAGEAIANAFSGSSFLYDLQLLPYCPIPDKVVNGKIVKGSMVENQDYQYIYNNGAKNIMFWCTKSNFHIDIQKQVNIANYKREANTQFYRLCSPNFAAAFDFVPAKNNGVWGYAIDYSYKPYSPYIHVAPFFCWLYKDGTKYYSYATARDAQNRDVRGLICSGDFSLPITSDTWNTYRLANVNYQNSFDREIKSMELSQGYEKQYEKWATYAGVIQSAAIGTQVGGSIGGKGGIIGGIVGGIGAGVASYVVGQKQIEINDKLRAEEISLKKDLWRNQLDNVKAQADTLSKVSAYNLNNKVFPVLEVYDCTDEEKTLFDNFINYNGMTINRIDTIANQLSLTDLDYSPTYKFISGSILRYETDLVEDLHALNNIASELKRGVYF